MLQTLCIHEACIRKLTRRLGVSVFEFIARENPGKLRLEAVVEEVVSTSVADAVVVVCEAELGPFAGVVTLPFVKVFPSGITSSLNSIPAADAPNPPPPPPEVLTDGVDPCLESGAFRVTVLLLPPKHVLWVFCGCSCIVGWPKILLLLALVVDKD